MAPSNIVKNAIQQLKSFTPCDIADGLLKQGFKNGGFFPNLIQFSKRREPLSSIGVAYTVTYAPLDDPRPAVSQSYIDQVPRGSVVVIGLTKTAQSSYAPYVTINNALYGGLMSTRAQYLGAEGLVIFGRIRDVQEHRDLGYPVWAYATGITAHKGTVKLVAINEPLEILVSLYGAETHYETISPGDIIVADENGVARIPVQDEGLVATLVEYVPKRVRADELVAADIKEGKEAKKSQILRRLNL